jgi:hypothetical protein
MKKTWILACSLALIATAGFALPNDAPVTLDMIFASPAPNSAAYTTKATCLANCGATSVSCSYTPPASCVAVDQNCSGGQQGYVSCNGVTTYCPSCSSGGGCTEGTIKNVTTGPICSCEDGASTPKDRYKCIGGEWVYQFSFCGGPFCPVYP